MLASVTDTANVASWLCGGIYVFAWSFSFYPQLLLNFRRQSTHGLTPDFPLLNVFGFTCYTVTNTVFLYSSKVRAEYAARNPASPEPTVRANDLVFGVHATVLCVLTYSQFWPSLWRWKAAPEVRRHAHKTTIGILCGCMLGVMITVVVVLTNRNSGDGKGPGWQWIDVIYAISFVKILLTISKYVPQVVANFRRQSTIGWSISQQLLDLTGGVFSLLQLIIDSASKADWSGITGNPLKFGLANISILFDIVFIIQHYVLYGPVEERVDIEGQPQSLPEREALLDSSR